VVSRLRLEPGPLPKKLEKSFLPVSCFAAEVTQPVTVNKSIEKTTAVTMDMGPSLL
jgi:hypothetical protein